MSTAASRPSEVGGWDEYQHGSEKTMSYAIVGFGKIGQALAHAFARKNIDVTVASRRPPEELTPQARAIGPTIVARSLQDALEADTIILAVPFGEHREVAKALPSWEGKTVIDATNAFGVLPEELDGLLSSVFVAKAFTGAKLVKGFNHLVAAILATDPVVEGGHRVVFLSSDDEDATAPVADLAKQLGFAPVKLGKLNEGGALVHARGRTWGQLIFQDLFKKQQYQSTTVRFGPKKDGPKRRIRSNALDVEEKERFQ
ncbi:MAG: NADPH-dependent F420 reductase [Candidatus Sulfotelmatobacter sp.]